MRIKIKKNDCESSNDLSEQQIELERGIIKAKRRAQIETMYNLYRRYYSLQIKLKNFDMWDNNRISAEIEKISLFITEGETELKLRSSKKPFIFLTIGLRNEIPFSSVEEVREEINIKLNKFSKKVDIIPFIVKNIYDQKEREVKFCYTHEQRSEVKTWDFDKKTGYIKGWHLHILMKTPDLKRSKIIKDYCESWSKALKIPKNMVDIQFLDEEHMKNTLKYINYMKKDEKKMKKVEIDKLFHDEILEGFFPYIDGDFV